jgi:predicted RNA-binding Zn-ribbon protein involved in translation (DUF1610 family)
MTLVRHSYRACSHCGEEVPTGCQCPNCGFTNIEIAYRLQQKRKQSRIDGKKGRSSRQITLFDD